MVQRPGPRGRALTNLQRVYKLNKRLSLEEQIEMLAASIRGRVVTPAQAEYDGLRALVPGNYDYRPAGLVRVANAADVAAAINFARSTGLQLAVRSGGHTGHGADGALVIDLRDINGIEIDTAARTAWAGTGLTAGEVTRAVEAHGLIVGFGDTASVGIGGLTSGGGIGYLVRKYGLTIDSVLAAEVVTANGDIVVADAATHPDLFFAVRGGAGNFGVVTRWKFQLHPLPEFTAGPLVLPATAEVVAGFVAAAEAAPEELSAIASVMPAPPLPFLPAELHGTPVFLCMMAYVGAAEAAAVALAPFRALATPHADLVRAAPYSSLYLPQDETARPAFSVRSRFIDRLGLAEARQIVETVEACEAPFALGEIRVLGGALARVAPEATAFAHRNARIMVSFIALSEDAAAAARHDLWAEQGMAALAQGTDRVYVNFITSDGPERVRAAYPAPTWDRLRQIKRHYDPDNLFRLNKNIPPAA
jgi:FAD/FMN-containing dehydrogenase